MGPAQRGMGARGGDLTRSDRRVEDATSEAEQKSRVRLLKQQLDVKGKKNSFEESATLLVTGRNGRPEGPPAGSGPRRRLGRPAAAEPVFGSGKNVRSPTPSARKNGFVLSGSDQPSAGRPVAGPDSSSLFGRARIAPVTCD